MSDLQKTNLLFFLEGEMGGVEKNVQMPRASLMRNTCQVTLPCYQELKLNMFIF